MPFQAAGIEGGFAGKGVLGCGEDVEGWFGERTWTSNWERVCGKGLEGKSVEEALYGGGCGEPSARWGRG